MGVSTSDIGSLDSTIFSVSSNSPKGLCVDIVEVPGLLFSTCQPLALNRLSMVCEVRFAPIVLKKSAN